MIKNVVPSCWVAMVLFAGVVGDVRAQSPYIPPQNLPATNEPPLAKPNELPKRPPGADDSFESIPVPRRLFNGAEPAAWNVPALASTPDVPSTPTVAIVVTAPGSIKAGDPITYKLLVENRSQSAAHHVWVSNGIPKNATFVKANPEPTEKTEGMIRWQIGTLEPRAKKTIELTLQPNGDGDVINTARVQFEHGEQVVTRVRGPQLSLKKIAAEHAYENEAIPCRLVVENSGVVAINNIVVKETVDEGLEHEGNELGSKAERTWDIGALKPGEKREVSYTLIAKRAAKLSSTAIATDGKVRTETKWSVTVGKSQVEVKLAGPEKDYVGQPSAFQAVVKNSGSIPLDNVAVVYHYPAGVRVARAPQDTESFKDRVQWNIARLEAGGTRTIRFSVHAEKPGLVEHKVSVLAKGSQSSSSVITSYVGAVGLHMTITESSNPTRKGAAVTYTIRVQNTGAATADNVVLRIDYPLVLMSFQRASAPHKLDKEKNRITLDPITVRGRDSMTVTVTMSALQSGFAKFHVELSGADLDPGLPIIVEQTTTIVD